MPTGWIPSLQRAACGGDYSSVSSLTDQAETEQWGIWMVLAEGEQMMATRGPALGPRLAHGCF